jgi:DNA-directed RNA polymerase specialized sigma subunit
MYKHYEKYKPYVLDAQNILRRHYDGFKHEFSQEDLAQNAYFRLIKSIKNYDEEKGTVKNYAKKVAINSIKSSFVKLIRHNKKLTKISNNCDNVECKSFDEIEFNETVEFAENAIKNSLEYYKHNRIHYKIIAFSMNYDIESGKLLTDKDYPFLWETAEKFNMTKANVSLILIGFRKRLKVEFKILES